MTTCPECGRAQDRNLNPGHHYLNTLCEDCFKESYKLVGITVIKKLFERDRTNEDIRKTTIE